MDTLGSDKYDSEVEIVTYQIPKEEIFVVNRNIVNNRYAHRISRVARLSDASEGKSGHPDTAARSLSE